MPQQQSPICVEFRRSGIVCAATEKKKFISIEYAEDERKIESDALKMKTNKKIKISTKKARIEKNRATETNHKYYYTT